MTDQPWTIERLRRMTRKEFSDTIKKGDFPPNDLAAQFLIERLRSGTERRR